MMTRNQFLRSLVGVGVGALGISALAGCDGDGAGEPKVDAPGGQVDAPKPPVDAPMIDAPPQPVCTTPAATIGTNHGHTLTVPLADVTAGVQKIYNIQGASLHPHTVTVTAAMFTMLKASTAIMVTSSLDAMHTHAVTVTCAT